MNSTKLSRQSESFAESPKCHVRSGSNCVYPLTRGSIPGANSKRFDSMGPTSCSWDISKRVDDRDGDARVIHNL